MQNTWIDRKIELNEVKALKSGIGRRVALGIGFLCAAVSLPGTLRAQVPAVVATQQLTYSSGLSSGNVALDACGNLYINENSGNTGLVRISAATGAVTTVVKNTNGYNGGTALYMDRAKKYLYMPDPANWYSSEFFQIPITNCVPGTPTEFANNDSSLFGYYYGTAQDISGDAAGNVYYTSNATNDKMWRIVKEAYTPSNTTTPYAGTVIYNSGTTYINYLASDASGNIYFSTSGSTIQLLKAPYTATPTTFATGFNSIAGLSFDAQNNLYVSDNGAGIVYEIPYSSTLSAPNVANQFAVAAVYAPFKVAVDANQNIYLSNNYPGAVELKLGGITAAPTVLGKTSGSIGISYMFNTSVTPTSITAVTGAAASGAFSAGNSGCTIGKTYAALSSCTQYASYTPTAVGLQSGAIVFASAAGKVTTNVSGVGQGAELTIDPGTVVNTTSGFSKPTGVAYDSVGNVYLLDATKNTLTEYAAGGGAGSLISTGTLTLSAPNSVAVDNIGNIFIADTGNNRIVEIPMVNGTLSSVGTVALSLTVKSPASVATDGSGGLYIADTGDNQLIYVPNVEGTLAIASASTFGSLAGPSAVTVDSSGDVYVTETGNDDLLEFPAPLGSAAQIKVASGFASPTALATDASGSVFVVDSGSGSIYRFPNLGGNLGTKALVGSTVTNPYGVAIDPAGNLYVTDATDALAVVIHRVTTALQFDGWNVGSTSIPFTGTLNSSGNTSLTFSSPSYTTSGNTAAGFKVTSDGCAGTTNLPGNSCEVTATFTPPVLETNAQENLVLQSNAANGTPTLELIGTGAQATASTLSLVLTSPSGATTLNAGQPVVFTATAVTAGNVPVPAGGSIQFYVNGNQVGSAATSKGAAVLSLPNGLTAGNAVVVSAVYDGTVVNGNQYYSGSQAQVTEDVIALPDMLSLAITAPTLWSNPLSANDNPANAKGPALNLIATISPSSSKIPTGTVSFYAGTSLLGIAQVSPGAGGTYQAGLVTTALRAGSTTQVEDDSYITNFTLSAVYSGDNTYYSSTAPSVPISIVSGPATQPACATAKTPTCNANTTGAFYTLTPTNPTITVASTTAGGPSSGSTTMTINSYGGWNGVLNFTCSGLPAYATCAPYPGFPNGVPSTPTNGATPTTFSFIINTNVTPIVPTGSGSMVWWVSGIGGLMLLMLRRRVKQLGYLRSGQLLTALGAVLLLSGSVLGMGGCGSQGYGFVTPAGSTNVTVKVSAAQLIPSSTNGSTYLPDPNPTTFQLTLVVK